jgi:hypothetical protein
MPARFRNLAWAIALVLALGAALGAWDATQGRRRQQQRRQQAQSTRPATAAPGGIAVRIQLGMKDTEPRSWAGEIRVSEGKVRISAALRPIDSIDGSRWKLGTRRQGQQPVQPAVLTATFDAPPAAKVEVETAQGRFAFVLAELELGKPAAFLDGAALAERVPSAQRLTSDDGDDDFPAAAAGADSSVWCAYVSYRAGTPIALDEIRQNRFDSLVTRNNGDSVRLMQFDGKEWKAPLDVTAAGLDLWRPAVAVDGKGRVWVTWSQKSGEDWEILARAYDPASRQWSEVERVSAEPGADINAAAATSSSGTVWVAWQHWDGGKFAVVAQALGGGKGTRRSRPSRPGNEWHPSVAADSKGRVHVAFDSYASGNYDVMLWSLDDRGSGAGSVLPIAASARFEARPSVAVDSADRVWVAYEDAEANWGKDFGMRWEGPSGVPFYLDRKIAVRSVSAGALAQTRADLEGALITTTYPPSQRHRVSYPRLGFDGSGRMWLLHRRHVIETGAGEHWVSYASSYEGNSWSAPLVLPESDNRLDIRPALARLKSGGLVAVFAGDGRSQNNRSSAGNDLFAVTLESPVTPKAPEAAPARAEGDGRAAAPVHPNESEDVRKIREFRASVGGKSYQLMRGEFHRHTELSSHRDQDGGYEEIWRYALDVARMDWIGPGDHDNGGIEYTWWLSQKQIDMYGHAPVFVPMYTYERSVVYPSGHRNVIFARRGIRPLPRLGTPQQTETLFGSADKGSPDIKTLYAYLKAFDGICASHTSATNMGTDWRDNDPAVEPVVEIYQGHRQNYEEPQAPKAAKDAADSIGGYQPLGYVWNAFRKGYKLGFEVSSDHVSTHISYAVVYAERPTREAILDAFKKRHSYGANDNIILDVRCGDRMMGDDVVTRTPPKLDIVVEGTAPVARIDVVRQIGLETLAYVYSAEPKQRSVRLSWTDTAARRGATQMYYVRIQQQGGAMAWASPMWVRYE